ncbi:hypothetical protein, partial [Bradyrhizobium diazoefficiens]|uniref:hypothetical protein n=1 Tax=Bradyrhizobium diazoefficiens TaxID=1355477 RepID=UPI002012D048
MLRLLVLVAFLLLPTNPLRAGATIVGAGSQSCTAWTNRAKSVVVKGVFESWVVGFISGLNVSGDREIVGGGDFAAIPVGRSKSPGYGHLKLPHLMIAVSAA